MADETKIFLLLIWCVFTVIIGLILYHAHKNNLDNKLGIEAIKAGLVQRMNNKTYDYYWSDKTENNYGHN